ncbi:MAG: Gfo/Idh/MocA family oxidoreductase [Victivallaceae bacterium]|nr:Gfo/Idh/MocA family oxidoreductase [Victivallaceae bacterium]
MRNLRIGIIGCAGRGELADFAHHPENGSEIVAGADIYPEARNTFLTRYQDKFKFQPTVYVDYREMIEKEQLDGVIITTPDFLHEEHAVYALNHKIAVYLEKPIAISIEGADRILEAAYRNRTKLVIGHNMRYMSFTRKMKEIIASGTIGDVKAIWCRHFISYGGDAYFRDWHAARKYSNSLLLQKGAHDIDIIHWLAGARTTRVNGMGSLSVYDKLPRRAQGDERLKSGVMSVWSEEHFPAIEQKDFYPEIEVEDINMISMRLANGVMASYEQCHFTPDTCRNYTVIGTKGRLENYGDYSLAGSNIQVWTKRKDAFRLEGDITYRVAPGDGNHGGADPLIIQSFLDAIRGQYNVWSTPQAARYSVATGCLGADSIRQGGACYTVPALPDYLENFDFARAEEKK